MSDYRNQSDRNRYRTDDEQRYGEMSERDARRRAAYGERDIYGEWDREAYGRTEAGYGRDRASTDRYGSQAQRGYGSSSFGGAYDDRYERGDAYRDSRAGYGSDRFGRRSEQYGPSSPSGYGYGTQDHYRQTQGYGRDARAYSDAYGDDAYRGEERGFIERAGDEIASWFGDRDAERRREADRQFGGRGPKSYTRSDDRIRDDINDRLTDDHYIDASDIEVSVKDREVTLSGHVPTRDQKRRAEDLAERVSGVAHVQNNLRIDTGTGTASTYGTTATATTGTVASASEIGGPRGWSTDTTVKTVS